MLGLNAKSSLAQEAGPWWRHCRNSKLRVATSKGKLAGSEEKSKLDTEQKEVGEKDKKTDTEKREKWRLTSLWQDMAGKQCGENDGRKQNLVLSERDFAAKGSKPKPAKKTNKKKIPYNSNLMH